MKFEKYRDKNGNLFTNYNDFKFFLLISLLRNYMFSH